MNKTLKMLMVTAFLSLPILCIAQDRLIRVNSESNAWRKSNPQVVLNNQEKARLLMPQGAAFGVECVPSFSKEWALTYDSVAHALVYKKADKSIWQTTYRAWHKKKKVKKNYSKWVLRKHPKNYEALTAKTFTLSITDQQAQRLKALWKDAISQAEDREVFILDGTKWTFFTGSQKAKSHRDENPLVKFTKELILAVCTGEGSLRDSLLSDETLHHCLEAMNKVEKPCRQNNDSIVVMTNRQLLLDSLCRLIRHRPKQFYYQQGELIDSMSMWTIVGAKEHFGIDCPVLQLKTVPDTLCNDYVRQHPEMLQNLCCMSGIVLDENDKPLADAWVGLYGGGAGAATDSTGQFFFWLPREKKFSFALYAECPGYQKLQGIDITQSPTLRIRLKPTAQKGN